MSQFIVMGPGNLRRNGKALGQGSEVSLSEQEFDALNDDDKAKLCRRGNSMADMAKEASAKSKAKGDNRPDNKPQGKGK